MYPIPEIDIKSGELVVSVDGQEILTIGQVSDKDCINLYLDVRGRGIMESEVADGEIIVDREKTPR